MKQFVIQSLRAAGLASLFVFTTAGTPSNGVPSNGVPSNGVPSNGVPSNGVPSNGVPSNGANLDGMENSLLFANKAVHTAFIGQAFTKANITDQTSPAYKVWFDPFSALLVSYLWQDAHAFGDDLVFTEPFTHQSFHFYGNLGLCDSGGNPPHG